MRLLALLSVLALPAVALAAQPEKVLRVPNPGSPQQTTDQLVSKRPTIPPRAYRVEPTGPGHYDTVAPVRRSFAPELERSTDRLPAP